MKGRTSYCCSSGPDTVEHVSPQSNGHNHVFRIPLEIGSARDAKMTEVTDLHLPHP